MFRLFNRYWAVPAAISLAVESGLLVLAVWLAYYLRFSVYYGRLDDITPAYFYSHFPLRAGIFALVVVLSLYFSGLYDFGERLSTRQLGIRLGRALTFAAGALLVVYYVTYPILTTGRGAFAAAMVLSAGFLITWRLLLSWFLRKRMMSDSILIVGTDEFAEELAHEIIDRDHLGYRIAGFLDDDPALQGQRLINPRVIGTTAQAWELARANQVSRVIVAQKDKRGKLDMDNLFKCKTSGIPVEDGSAFYEQLTGKINLEGLRKSWLIFSQGFVVSPSALLLKRVLDVVAAAVLLALTAPLMLLAALALRLDSPGPVFYRQVRVGLRGKLFTLWKFRSMQTDAETSGDPRWTDQGDTRVTRVGRILRKSRIDELPQLWNVFVGDMSLVGPRPERAAFIQRLLELNPIYEQRLVVRPGLTGWAQIMAPYASSFEESLEKLKYDLYYIKNLSFFLDLSILASTARIVLLGRGSR